MLLQCRVTAKGSATGLAKAIAKVIHHVWSVINVTSYKSGNGE
jgi:hypothetical protein